MNASTENSVKHTPGPWLAVGPATQNGVGDYAIVAKDSRIIIAEAFASVGPGQTAPADANARLMTAAPDLLGAAVMAEVTLCLFDATCGDTADPAKPCNECPGCAVRESLDALRAAIKKATQS